MQSETMLNADIEKNILQNPLKHVNDIQENLVKQMENSVKKEDDIVNDKYMPNKEEDYMNLSLIHI